MSDILQFGSNVADPPTGTPRYLSSILLPRIIDISGEYARKRFFEFFTVNIRNLNTRKAYYRAVSLFLGWCEARGLRLEQIDPVTVAAYIEQHPCSPPTVKQHLAAIRVLFDWLVIGQVVKTNPASSVRGPKYVVEKGKTPILSKEKTRELINSINLSTVIGLRDRAIIGVMVYSFARVGAVVALKVTDYYQNGNRWWLRLHEKGGRFHEMPAHHKLKEYINDYIEAAQGVRGNKEEPLFRTAFGKTKKLTLNPMVPADVYRMIRRRARKANISTPISCHTFRAIGITNYLENGGKLEDAQAMAAHRSPRTTKLYDRRGDKIKIDEVERILI